MVVLDLLCLGSFSVLPLSCSLSWRTIEATAGLPTEAVVHQSPVWWLLTELSHWRPWWEPGGGRLGEAGVISLLLLPWVDALAAGEFFLWLQLPLYRLSTVPALLAHGLSWVPAVLPLVFVLQPKGGIGFLLLLTSGLCHHFLFDSQLSHHLCNPFCTLNPFCLFRTCSGRSSTSLFCEEEFGAQRG